MARVRVAVALVIPGRAADEVDGLRNAFGADTDYIAPHITLVPPLNLAEEAVGPAMAVLRDVAASVSGPLALSLGPLGTFLPRNPVLFLEVGGEVDRLEDLRDRCRQAPLDRPDERPFVPHVTVARGLRPDDDSTSRRLLAHYRNPVEIDRLHLLVQVTETERGRRWVEVADVVLGPRQVVGTGGLELELATTRLADPEVRQFVQALGPNVAPPMGGPDAFVIAARHDGGLLGGAWGTINGRAAQVLEVAVRRDWRRRGVGAHVVAQIENHAVRRGVTAIEARHDVSSPVDALFESRGWTLRPGPGGPRRWRALAPDPEQGR